jgi:hypothetical protein
MSQFATDELVTTMLAQLGKVPRNPATPDAAEVPPVSLPAS